MMYSISIQAFPYEPQQCDRDNHFVHGNLELLGCVRLGPGTSLLGNLYASQRHYKELSKRKILSPYTLIIVFYRDYVLYTFLVCYARISGYNPHCQRP